MVISTSCLGNPCYKRHFCRDEFRLWSASYDQLPCNLKLRGFRTLGIKFAVAKWFAEGNKFSKPNISSVRKLSGNQQEILGLNSRKISFFWRTETHKYSGYRDTQILGLQRHTNIRVTIDILILWFQLTTKELKIHYSFLGFSAEGLRVDNTIRVMFD